MAACSRVRRPLEPAFVFDVNGELRHRLGSTGIPLGLNADANFPEGTTVDLAPGDLLLLLLTDGIPEAVCPEGEMFGIERVLAFVRERIYDAPDVILESLMARLDAFTEGHDLDDRTAVIVRA